MNAAPELRVTGVDLFEAPYRLRLPFRFGVITVTEGVQAIARVRVRLADGREATGYAAEALGAKWFDKNPQLSDEDNRHQLRRAVQLTRDAYLQAGPMTAFGLHAKHYPALIAACGAEQSPPLVASYGPALLDRAVLDALCRAQGISFFDAMRANLAGLDATLTPDLADFDLPAMLAGLAPLPRIDVRHTVGLVDPITAADQAPGTRVNDGLPETLEEVIATYGNRWFKLKVSGQLDADIDRLARIAAVLDAQGSPYRVTLDGNEQYADAAAITALWERARVTPALAQLVASTLLIEQPIKRQQALAEPVDALARHRPVIIDESDGEIDAFLRARALGYAGVSTKSCKGLYKSLLNLARCRMWNAQEAPGAAGRYFMSAEDLTMQPGTAVQQDLALVSLMGITHVERNAHHFIDGFDGRPRAEAREFMTAHPDLYEDTQGPVRLRLMQGQLALGSLATPGFGSGVSPQLDSTAAMPAAAWPAAA
ncbi:MAG: mandelate racemase [Burkholderiales bacterium]|nr:mandelate racemase [Burkholderiales bacterium]